MTRNDRELSEMPFNGAEFGKILLNENNLHDVKIEGTEQVDHYDLNDKTVRVQEARKEKKIYKIPNTERHWNRLPPDVKNKYIKMVNTSKGGRTRKNKK